MVTGIAGAPAPGVTKLQGLADALLAAGQAFHQLTAHRQTLTEEMARLKRDGLTYGNPHYRLGKYLYVVHPVDRATGERRRDYVGSDPEKIRAALDAMNRAKRYEEARRHLARLDAHAHWALDLAQDLKACIEQW